ncbi:hypothetical protein BH11PLA1_BH11PLA1_22370 [soil metagenome]
MPRPLVLVHGYSDTSAVMAPLATELAARLGTGATVIALADYITLNDYVSFTDLLVAMDAAWTDRGLPREAYSVDMVVHSTGGLIARQWLAWVMGEKKDGPRGNGAEPCPVKHLCMLAPANFGSPLAHKGESFIGRVLKGFQANSDGPLQSGRLVLKGLELASPLTWNLAMKDCFSGATPFAVGKCLCTVLVGDQGYDGIAAMANENGGDGTVRVSTANLNCARVVIDFTETPHNPGERIEECAAKTGFGLVAGVNHATILLNGLDAGTRADVVSLIENALSVEDDGFEAWCARLEVLTAQASAGEAGYQNLVVKCEDQEGRAIPDYVVEFYERDSDDGGLLARIFHQDALENVHVHSSDASLRSLYVNCSLVLERIDRVGETMSISVTAEPQLEKTHGRVGFRSYDDRSIGGLDVPPARIREFFKAHRTLLMTIRLRWHRGRLFRFAGPGDGVGPL